MIRALVLLLAVLLAFPASATPACHEAKPAARMATHHRSHPAPVLPAEHSCLGCAADVRVATPQPARTLYAAAAFPRFSVKAPASLRARPIPPPPRPI